MQNWPLHPDIRNVRLTRIHYPFKDPSIRQFLADSVLPSTGQSAGGRRLRVDTVGPSCAPQARQGGTERKIPLEGEVGARCAKGSQSEEVYR